MNIIPESENGESIFDYELNEIEYKIMNPQNIDKKIYLQSSSQLKILRRFTFIIHDKKRQEKQ